MGTYEENVGLRHLLSHVLGKQRNIQKHLINSRGISKFFAQSKEEPKDLSRMWPNAFTA